MLASFLWFTQPAFLHNYRAPPAQGQHCPQRTWPAHISQSRKCSTDLHTDQSDEGIFSLEVPFPGNSSLCPVDLKGDQDRPPQGRVYWALFPAVLMSEAETRKHARVVPHISLPTWSRAPSQLQETEETERYPCLQFPYVRDKQRRGLRNDLWIHPQAGLWHAPLKPIMSQTEQNLKIKCYFY